MAKNRQRQHGRLQEQRIITSLQQKTKTTQQLADALGMCRSNVAIYLERMRRAPRRVFICDYEERTGRPAPIYAAGDKPDVEYAPLSRPTPKTSAAERLSQALRLLAEKPRTLRELGPAMNMVPGAAGKHVRTLRTSKPKQVFIESWRHPSEVSPDGTGGDWAPVYAAGDKPDAPKPPRETGKARHARLHKKKEYRDARNKARRARYQVEKVVKKHTKAGPQPWFAALTNIGSQA